MNRAALVGAALCFSIGVQVNVTKYLFGDAQLYVVLTVWLLEVFAVGLYSWRTLFTYG